MIISVKFNSKAADIISVKFNSKAADIISVKFNSKAADDHLCQGGTIPQTSEIEHIFVVVITFSPFLLCK